MLRNYLAAAFGNLVRNGLYAGVTIAGLTIGFAATILIGLYVRDEFSYDRFIPGYGQVYRISQTITGFGSPPLTADLNPFALAGQTRAAYPGVASIARLDQDFPIIRQKAGDPGVVDQTFAWADPDFFKVVPLPALAGDPKRALDEPGTVVITRRVARTYLHADVPIGQNLNVDGHLMRVTAVLADLPSETHLVTKIFASSRSSYSLDGLRASLARSVAPSMVAKLAKVGPATVVFEPVALADIHLHPAGLSGIVTKPPGNRAVLYALAAIAGLIVLVASLNFVTLMTARAARRAVEVGVRKTAGAQRIDLVMQFVGESLIYVALSMLAATAAAELLLSPVNTFLQRRISFHYFTDPGLILAIAGTTMVVSVLAGFYPAAVMSAFKPAAVLKGGLVTQGGGARARQAMVMVQFAIMIGLIFTTTTIYRQTTFALNRGLSVDSARIVDIWTNCQDAFAEEVKRLPGVERAACGSLVALNSPIAKNTSIAKTRTGADLSINLAPVDFGLMELNGWSPLAGRLFSAEHGDMAQQTHAVEPPVIINMTALRRLGYASPKAAVGQALAWRRFLTTDRDWPPFARSPIVGVIADTPVSVRTPIEPLVYFVDRSRLQMLSIRLTGKDTSGTVRAIERIWRQVGNTRPIQEVFVQQYYRQTLYLDVIQQGAVVAVCAGLAIFIAALGLFALSVFTSERRTKEIGIRKAMGAGDGDILRLLLWEFTKPVLWANLIAWPASWLVMTWWLRGFAYHVDLPPGHFLAAGAAALAIAWLTVGAHAFIVARAKPVSALRHE